MSARPKPILGSPRIPCETCGKTFAREASLLMHRALYHSDDFTSARIVDTYAPTVVVEPGQNKQAIIYTGALFCFLYSDFDKDFIEELKTFRPKASQRWDPVERRWLVLASHYKELEKLLRKFKYQVTVFDATVNPENVGKMHEPLDQKPAPAITALAPQPKVGPVISRKITPE